MAYDQSHNESAQPDTTPEYQPAAESGLGYVAAQRDPARIIADESAPLRQTQPGSADNVEFAEPTLPPAEKTVAPDEVEPMSTEEFAQDDPRHIYERMRPDQRTAIAGEFMRLFRLSNDPDAQRYDSEIHEMWPPERVAELHRYAQQRHPEIFEEVMRHPVTLASLETPGVVVDAGSEGEEAVPGQVADIPDKHDANLLP